MVYTQSLMPIYQLTDDLIFPSVEGAEDGIVAVGGDLLPERLIIAYQSGIFPWYSKGDPIIWWSPDPRFVLFPDRLHISKSMKRVMNNKEIKVTFNQNFEQVISECKQIPRPGQKGTWITDEMELAYIRLHDIGVAESVEVWKDKELVGGMYGVRIGKVFSGESMFSKASNTSKLALIHFMRKFRAEGGELFDCQVHSDHMERMGAEELSRESYLGYLR
ncbi:leucyl/phenylalanyl-tRNA--protein transferase [Ekhidna lutea]|uniref:Leucyl/phenylalanyl-tRNA--protein transferase n=2 Tax=Ekhidna lutea TaxID=447679 RepID=A0A239JMD4_EKHLU|nr:leucyl/phenylalanyl-tRNA--protein transferase [Ekhidna lutea]